jgi:hypothetical protein
VAIDGNGQYSLPILLTKNLQGNVARADVRLARVLPSPNRKMGVENAIFNGTGPRAGVH